jgi:hypothetical protein
MQPKQYIELFHLLFLDQLGRKMDKQAWALKGGCNLRFFFHSVRYSEDMDLDLGDIPVHILREKVSAVLAGRPFRDILAVRQIAIEHVTPAKQTGTTQRWKLGLLTPAAAMPVPTKIEFSRRGMLEGVVFGPVAAELVREYELSPLWANHYDASAACVQKLNALVSRAVVQARDVFDLHVLLPYVAAAHPLDLPEGRSMAEVEERALSIGFEVFKSQVLSYLPPDLQARYDAPGVWETLVLETLDRLKGRLK